MKAHMGPVLTLGLLGVLLLARDVAATQFKVGGSSGWSVPPGNNSIHNDWAEKMRFQVGDSLLFVYDSSKDSVLRVTKDDYASCNTGSPLEKHADGHTVFTFSQSGPYYFISGNKGNCLKNEKLVVVVLADRGRMASLAPSPAPLASSPLAPPTQSPSPTETPSSPPSAVETPASSPPSSVETPATSPSSEVPSTPSSPPRNDAGSIVRGVAGSVGALLGSAVLLAMV